MTGRDLILYILRNNLEDEPVFKDGTMLGFITIEEAAKKFEVGVGTIYAYIMCNRIDHVFVGTHYLFPADCELKNGGNNENTREKKTTQGVNP